MRRVTLLGAVLAAAFAALSGCTVHQSDPPPVTGPSELGLSIGVTATPDALNRDGGSQSSIVVSAHDATGQPMPGLTVRLDVEANGGLVTNSFGTLSATTIVTGGDGTARAIYTAPAAPQVGTVVTTNAVSILATPIGSNAQGSLARSADIRLMSPGAILPSGPSPVANFTFAPTSPTANSPVQFDGSSSCAQPTSGTACTAPPGAIVSFRWTFSDGGTASGMIVSHNFALAQTYSITLTVTNSDGISASRSLPITVGGGAPPTGDFSFSPTPPNVGDTVQFNADGLRAAPGHTIVQYSWNFGDPGSAVNTASTQIATHVFTAPGTYNVVLTVRDDADQKTTITKAVAVGTGKPIATFSFSQGSALTHTVNFDASGSSAIGSATITDYTWSFGDGSPAFSSGTSPITSHDYGSTTARSVTLTVTDSLARKGVSSPVSVTPP